MSAARSSLLSIPFLTALDTRAAIRGSRDPLGVQPIWMHFGRKVVGNLTTQTTSVRDFTIAMLGFWFIEQLSSMDSVDSELAVFLRWEQLAAYARAGVNRETGFRGTDRVHKALRAGDRLRISTERQHQILSDQQRYGIWGLYSVASRASGLIGGDPIRLTPAARAHVERELLPKLDRHGAHIRARLLEVLRGPAVWLDPAGKDRALLKSVAGLISPDLSSIERDFYRLHLLHGGGNGEQSGLQRQLVELVDYRLVGSELELQPATMGGLAKEARKRFGAGCELSAHIEQIRTAESLLALSGSLFAWLLVQHDARRDALAEQLQKAWGASVPRVDPEALRQLEGDFTRATRDSVVAHHWMRAGDAFAAGAYDQLIDQVIALNQRVMSARNGSAPWVEWTAQGRLKVRFRDERAVLPKRSELTEWWRNSYFIDSLRQIATALGEEGR